jgi:hypothetical protein
MENGPHVIKLYQELPHESNVKKHKNKMKDYGKKLSNIFFDKEHDKQSLEKVMAFKQWSTRRVDKSVWNKRVYVSNASWLMERDEEGHEKTNM